MTAILPGIVIDSSALIAIASAPTTLLSAVNLLETSMVLATHTGDAASWTDLDALIARAAIQIIP